LAFSTDDLVGYIFWIELCENILLQSSNALHYKINAHQIILPLVFSADHDPSSVCIFHHAYYLYSEMPVSVLGLNECNKMPFSYPFYVIILCLQLDTRKLFLLNACNEAKGILINSDTFDLPFSVSTHF
jgi:hypothetical protein